MSSSSQPKKTNSYNSPSRSGANRSPTAYYRNKNPNISPAKSNISGKSGGGGTGPDVSGTIVSTGRGMLSAGSYQMHQYPPGSLQTEDNLEYFIKFPTPKFNNDSDAAESDYVFVYNETNVPIVMLLGWAGCQDKYLMKYSKIYEDRGLITIRYTAPVDTLFWKRTAMVPIGEKILKLIYDMNFDSHPLIFHVFSNGGAYLYQHISLAMQKNKSPLQIRGMIFDSAPGERRVLGLYRAIQAIYGREKNKSCNCISALVITVTLSFMWFCEETFTAFKSLFIKTEPTQTNPFNDLKNDCNDFPQLFMYSKADVVIPYQDVESFAKYRERRGIQTSKICFEDAEHVKIFTKYPQHYIHCVCKFINNCLATYRESTSKYD